MITKRNQFLSLAIGTVARIQKLFGNLLVYDRNGEAVLVVIGTVEIKLMFSVRINRDYLNRMGRSHENNSRSSIKLSKY